MYRKPDRYSFFPLDVCLPPDLGGFVPCSDSTWRRERRRSEERWTAADFPPPMKSLDRNGRRSFVLRPVRAEGRLELTEVEIRRPEIMYAVRSNGRLTLRLIEPPAEEEEEEVTEEAGGGELDAEELEGEGERIGGGDFSECKRSPESGGEGRRCYEYRQLSVWTPRVVATI